MYRAPVRDAEAAFANLVDREHEQRIDGDDDERGEVAERHGLGRWRQLPRAQRARMSSRQHRKLLARGRGRETAAIPSPPSLCLGRQPAAAVRTSPTVFRTAAVRVLLRSRVMFPWSSERSADSAALGVLNRNAKSTAPPSRNKPWTQRCAYRRWRRANNDPFVAVRAARGCAWDAGDF